MVWSCATCRGNDVGPGIASVLAPAEEDVLKMRRTIVCLANSYKHGGRCVAGVCLEDRKWVRLRSAEGDGSLSLHYYLLADGHGELRLLDVFEAELQYAMPSNCHPEDWVAMPSLRLVERPCPAKSWNKVIEKVEKSGSLLGGYGDRVWASLFLKRPAAASLALVCPTDIWWWVREERGKIKCRALFRRNNVTYDLAVTDPRWLEQMKLLPVGIHAHRLLAPETNETWLTISLSEAFSPGGGGVAHFRIVAGVILR